MFGIRYLHATWPGGFWPAGAQGFNAPLGSYGKIAAAWPAPRIASSENYGLGYTSGPLIAGTDSAPGREPVGERNSRRFGAASAPKPTLPSPRSLSSRWSVQLLPTYCPNKSGIIEIQLRSARNLIAVTSLPSLAFRATTH